MYPLKQSTAATIPIFVHDVAGDAVTGLVDAGFTKRISKNGGAFAAMTVTITEMENGFYSVPISASHSDTLGVLTMLFTHGSAKQINLQYRVSARLPDDMAFPNVSGRGVDVDATGGVEITPNQAVDVAQWNGSNVAAPTIAGVPEVDLTHIGGVAQSAADLKDFADDGYDPATNKVQGVVLVDTTTANTDMRGTESAALASVATEARLAELDAANLPADLDAVLVDTADMQPRVVAIEVDTGTTLQADIATAQADLDILTGADGAILASAQGPVTFTGVTNEAGLTLIGAGTGPGLNSTGGATGHGIASVGGATSGNGINSAANGDGNGIDAIGVGTNAGLRTAGGATGPGIHAHGGATGATPGVEFHAHSATGDALELEADGSGDSNADLAAILADTTDMQPIVERMAYLGSRGPGVFLDDAAANTNTVLGTDGTEGNPVSTIAAAITLAGTLGSKRIYLLNDSLITLAATMQDYEFVGVGEFSSNVITLGSQDVDHSHFINCTLTGTQAGALRMQATDCDLLSVSGLECTAMRCALAGTLTARQDCFFDSCWSASAGAAAPVLDINSVANININMRHYSGGLQIDNAVATTVVSYESDGQLTIDATCTSLTISVRGNCSITDNGTTTAITQDAAVNRTAINAEVDTALADVNLDHIAGTAAAIPAIPAGTYLDQIMDDGTATFDRTTDSLQAIADSGGGAPTVDQIADAVWDEAKAGHVAAGSFGEEVQAHALSTEVTALNDLSAAQVNAEVVDALNVDTITLPSQEAPPLAPTHRQAIAWLYKTFRNRKTQTATEWSLLADDESTVDAKATVSDIAGTATKEEIVAGP